MSNKFRAFFISLSLLALLAFSAFGTIPAYADDGTTTGSTDTTTTTGTDPGAVTTDTGEQPTADAPPAADTTPLLEQVPDNTTVTVVDASGEVLPLASQESADAVTLSDPIWCPATQTVPTPGQNGCTESYTSFTDLLNFLEANQGDATYQVDGTIYVEQGTYQGGEQTIDFNTHNLSTLQQYDLTVTGGWNTTNNTVNSTSNFSVPIVIGSNGNPWTGSVTLNNIVINGADQTGLTLYSQGDVALSNVEVTNSQNGIDVNAGGNVTINNSNIHKNKQKGANVNSGGNVNISQSEFSDNGSGDITNPTGSGLGIQSNGAVTLLEVAADGNQLFGANINAGGPVSITQGFFDGNQGYYYDNGWQYTGYGLTVVTPQNITLDSVTADDNYLFGASLQGANISVTNASFRGNSSDWDDPLGYGLNIQSTGAVTLASVHADNNQMYGANITATSSVVISDSFFNGNQSYYWSGDKTYYGYGLQVVTSADIALLTVSADGNYVLGAHLEGSEIAIRDSSFSNNGSGSGLDLIGKGLEIVGVTVDQLGTGNVALRNVVADNNQLFGANIQTTGNVAINTDAGKTTSFSGHITYVYDANSGKVSEISGGYGLQIVADGDIAIRGVTATNNYEYGASLDGMNVDISDSMFNSNGSGVNTIPTGYGININSKGAVSIRNISASNNQLYGANITATGNISILTGFFSGHQTVTFDPCHGLTFYGYGLTAYSKEGDVTLDGVEANFNNLWGASLDGMSVFVSNSQFNNNVSDSSQFIDDTGLIVNSRGDFVLLDNVEAKNNRLIGATITAVGDVYIVNNSTFTGNAGVTCVPAWCPPGSQTYWGYGLKVVTPGMIVVDTINASNNNLYGADLQGSTVTVTNSTFDNNRFQNGLVITATGDVTLTNVTATNNGANGVKVTSTGACVQVVGGTFTGNDLYGIRVSGAPLSLDGTQVFGGNGSGDVFQDNAGGCVVPTSIALQTTNAAGNSNSSVASTSNNTTTLNAGSTTSNTTVSSDSKKTKGKKVVAKHNKRKVAKVRVAKVRHGRR